MNQYFTFKESLLNKYLLYDLVDEYDPVEKAKIMGKITDSMVLCDNGVLYVIDAACEIREHELTVDNVCGFISMFISASYKKISYTQEVALFKKQYVNATINVCSNEYIMKFVKQFILMYTLSYSSCTSECTIESYLNNHFQLEEWDDIVPTVVEKEEKEEEEEEDDDDEENTEYSFADCDLKSIVSSAIAGYEKKKKETRKDISLESDTED